ncbi:acetoacetate decarboxylase family protein [Microbacterium lacus]|uniref:acetoacetate decarboxylase family protein n=1 Tax=Microbacterium lacus TaxID=415217 RepID=UPI0038503B11
MSVVSGAPSEWITGRDGVPYPPEPWRLHADFGITLFLVPVAALPPEVAAHAPAGARMLRLGDRAIVGVAAVRYGEGSVLTYDELLVAVPVWHRGGLRVSISQIWVDSAASRTGGRELWGIPKHLMTTQRHASGGHLEATFTDAAGAPLASVSAEPTGRLPGRWPLPLPTAQRLPDVGWDDRISLNRMRAGIHSIRAEWRFDGPLSWLRSARPVVCVGLSRADITFGQ